MREGKAKYALRGQMIQLANYPTKDEQKKVLAKPVCCSDQIKSPDDYALFEGLYQNENEFASAPPAFLVYARQQWRKWRMKDSFD